MLIRYTITVSGNAFTPTQIKNLILKNLKIVENFDCSNNCEGIMQIQHIQEFSKYYDSDYENDFIAFFENNFDELKRNNADEYSLFIEVYYKDQCNFEIFDKDKLTILSRYQVSLPISVYHIDTDYNSE